jgi:hypothetical protein
MATPTTKATNDKAPLKRKSADWMYPLALASALAKGRADRPAAGANSKKSKSSVG